MLSPASNCIQLPLHPQRVALKGSNEMEPDSKWYMHKCLSLDCLGFPVLCTKVSALVVVVVDP